jgi:hypothetical protein
LKPLAEFAPPPGHIEGAGPVYLISHKTNNSFKAINAILSSGGQVNFTAKFAAPLDAGTIVISGISHEKLADIANKNSLVVESAAKIPQETISTKKPRVGLYRPWEPSIDEGWTRWILEDYGFAPITLRNGDIQASHLLDRFDAIILPDERPASMLNGFAPGSISGEYVGGIGAAGIDALRQFVQAGGTLIAFNHASLFAIDSFGLPVTNVLAGLKEEEFYCAGSLLRVEIHDPAQPSLWGMPRDPAVMFERGPAFAPKPNFRGAVVASYAEDANPLASGYLLHPERIEGKAAAIEVAYGDGRVYLFGFKPQWRGQSHGTYKLIFNAIYDSPSLAKPTTFAKLPLPPIVPPPATKPEAKPEAAAADKPKPE